MEGEKTPQNIMQKNHENETTKLKVDKLNEMLDQITFSDSNSDANNNNPNKKMFILSLGNYPKEI